MHKIAVIDLGTNTFNLLIASKSEENFDVIYSEKSGVALGMGGIINDIISEDAFIRGIDTMIHFKQKCIEFDVEKIIAIGTSALRDAKNSVNFVDKVKKLLDLDIEIISGEREAELIYKGVKWSFDFTEPSLIMDIGGGSTEFIFVDKNGIVDKKSFNIGVSRIYQELVFSDPYTQENVTQIENWLDEKTNSYFKSKKCAILIGASGSFETFYEMIYNRVIKRKISALEFSILELKETLNWIIFSKQEERDKHPFIIPIRRKMAPIAAIKTRWIIENVGILRTFVTPCSLKEGILYESFIENL